jgi:hypothetical protein
VSLSINGHKGFMLKNYTQNIGDTEAMVSNTAIQFAKIISLQLLNWWIISLRTQFLAYSLKANRSLTMLDLSVNGIGDEGATHLAQVLA